MRNRIVWLFIGLLLLVSFPASAEPGIWDSLFKVKKVEPAKPSPTPPPAASEKDLAVAQALSRAFAAVVKRAAPAVVFIEVEKTVVRKEPHPFPFGPFPFDFFGDDFLRRFFPQLPRKYKQRGAGSGFIVTPDGYIYTNNHVVADADRVIVKLADGRTFKGKVVGKDPQSDVAVLKIDGQNLPTVPLGDSDKIQVGEWVIAIGNPFGLSHTVTVGVVSAKGRSGLGITDYEDFIQTDAAINPGNSGGPLLNLRGEVIGMNTAIFTRSGGYMGIGFAIPINIVKLVAEQLIKQGKVVRGWLGVVVQDLTPALAEEFGLKSTEGTLVAEVMKGSPADRAGLQRGDVIVEYEGKPVRNSSELRTYVGLTHPGTTVTMKVLRNGRPVTLKVTIGEYPKREELSSAAPEIQKFLEALGFEVRELTPDLAQELGYSVRHGVIVAAVAPGSPAAMADLRPGLLIEEVNRRPVKTLEEFYRALEPSLKSGRVLLLVRDQHFRRFVVLSVR
ncbi:DegQ family serine endoprotease [Thermosulfurimonas marina]|uniref:Probable periplasmic serine endoprotease DegP-like n=1 Tax=Thermosulfurimonas marina TaxID=2047767 RepID=A0A6H1WRT9_9BACT|nr:DegQ family serine endoprotease [Thermosulfurimonas marina]QJA05935.1 DegQ family serine endoprotease [Thermosulfurimonas marina]